jgi:hypothetical protein
MSGFRVRAYVNVDRDPADLGEASAAEMWCSVEIPMTDSEFRKFAKAVAAQFVDRCVGCGKHLDSEMMLLGYDRSGRAVQAGHCCPSLVARPAGFGLSVPAAAAPAEWLYDVETSGSA